MLFSFGAADPLPGEHIGQGVNKAYNTINKVMRGAGERERLIRSLSVRCFQRLSPRGT